jgi:hypothetical protein
MQQGKGRKALSLQDFQRSRMEMCSRAFVFFSGECNAKEVSFGHFD